MRIKKFNSSVGAILCSGCNIIVMDGFVGIESPYFCTNKRITKKDWKSNKPMYCEKCKKEKGIIL